MNSLLKFFFFQMTERITFKPKMTRTAKCKSPFALFPKESLHSSSSSLPVHTETIYPTFTSPFVHSHLLSPPPHPFLCVFSPPPPPPPCSWISVLQNSKEEALNQAFKGDQHVGENNIVQELTKAILAEVKRMTGNDVCCDCGAPSK